MTAPGDALSRIRQAVRCSERGHSRLFLWMRAHHDALAEEFAANVPDWQRLAGVFGAEGLTDGTGKPPSPAAARLTWYRVRQAVRSRRQVQKGKELPLSEAEGSPPEPSPHYRTAEPAPSPFCGDSAMRRIGGAPVARTDDADQELDATPRFQLARPIGLTVRSAPGGPIQERNENGDE